MIVPDHEGKARESQSHPDYPELTGLTYTYFKENMSHTQDRTQRMYSKLLVDFLRYHQADTEEFYKWVLDHRDPDDRRNKDALKNLLDNYFNQLLTREVKPQKFNTVILSVSAVNHFLKGNGEDIGYKYKKKKTSVKQFNKQMVADGQYRIEREKIIYMMSLTTSPQYRSVITMLKDSGLRASDMSQIQYKHIQKALQDPDIEYITFEIIPIKNMSGSGLTANVVLGPDCLKYLRIWDEKKKRLFENRYDVEVRNKKNGYMKHLTPKHYEYKNGDEDYVYCFTQTKKTHIDKNGRQITGCGFGQPLTQRTGASMIQIIKRNDIAAFYKISAHSFRKNHTTGLTKGGVPERWLNVMQGILGEGTRGVYHKPNPEELIEIYSKAYHEIALEKSESEEIKTLNAQLEASQTLTVSKILGDPILLARLAEKLKGVI